MNCLCGQIPLAFKLRYYSVNLLKVHCLLLPLQVEKRPRYLQESYLVNLKHFRRELCRDHYIAVIYRTGRHYSRFDRVSRNFTCILFALREVSLRCPALTIAGWLKFQSQLIVIWKVP